MSGPSTAAGAVIVDADAVCEVCGNVHAEPTLICRVCGNNLRDQKARRLAAEVMLLEPERPGGSQLVRGGLVALALLVVWVGVNANRIADTVISTGTESNPLLALFEAPQEAAFAPMLLEAESLAPTLTAEDAQRLGGGAGPTADGRYALLQSDPYTGLQVVGAAIVQTGEDGDTRFVASLLAGGHIRGFLQSTGTSAFRSGWNEAAAMDPAGEIFGVSGVAVSQADGTVECFGQSALDDAAYEVIAYRLP
jgi:hypothetical protein